MLFSLTLGTLARSNPRLIHVPGLQLAIMSNVKTTALCALNGLGTRLSLARATRIQA